MANGAIDELIDEELHVGTTASAAVADAGDADFRGAPGQVEALERAVDDLEAGQQVAGAAVGRAVGARLELVGFADVVAANRTNAAILFATGAVFGFEAAAVAAAFADAAIIGAGEAGFAPRIAGAVAAGVTSTTVGGAGQAVFTVFDPAETISAAIAMPTVGRAARTGLDIAARAVAAGFAQPAVDRADAAILRASASAVAAGFAQSAVFGATGAGFVGVGGADAVAAGLAASAVTRAASAILVVSAQPVAAGLAPPTVFWAGGAGLAARWVTHAITARIAGAAIGRARRAAFTLPE